MGSIEAALADLESLKPGERPNYAQIGRKHGVDRSTLSKRHRHVQQSREARYEAQRILNDQQSETLIKWINNLIKRGLPPSNEMLRNFAKEIFGKEPERNWLTRWLRRYNDRLISLLGIYWRESMRGTTSVGIPRTERKERKLSDTGNNHRHKYKL
jgi:hypothetical protein